jgi:hypothetical protein
MTLVATDKGGAEFEMTPEGTYIARCYKIIDLGTQTTTGMFGTKEQHKVMISWELFGLDENIVMKDNRPFSVTQWYTVSLHEKSKLRADLEAWRGKKFTKEELEGFDLGSILGAYCMIQVVHDESGKYANVNAIMAYKGKKPDAFNDNVVFDIDEPDMAVFEAMSDNMKAKIMSAPEWKGAGKLSHNEPDEADPKTSKDEVTVEDIEGDPINLDDIPF